METTTEHNALQTKETWAKPEVKVIDVKENTLGLIGDLSPITFASIS